MAHDFAVGDRLPLEMLQDVQAFQTRRDARRRKVVGTEVAADVVVPIDVLHLVNRHVHAVDSLAHDVGAERNRQAQLVEEFGDGAQRAARSFNPLGDSCSRGDGGGCDALLEAPGEDVGNLASVM